MSITYSDGDIFDSGADILVCPVNCVGVMGKGLALEFRKRYPWCNKLYKTLCDSGELKPGLPRYVRNDGVAIALFPTKLHWRNQTDPEWIANGLWHVSVNLRHFMKGYKSIAVPALGCGLGGLDWPFVKEMIDHYLDGVQQDVIVYPPKGA